eukprot:m.182790 g.182790  ORF g.182790 m.182790 type:complete len:273 (-) comp18471_c1_seq1:390-1208(-)
MANIETQFSTAIEFIQSLPKDGEIKITDGQKLQFYGLFKQATKGNCTTNQPSMFQVVARAKWNAWKGYTDMSRMNAKLEYIDLLLKTSKGTPGEDKIRSILYGKSDSGTASPARVSDDLSTDPGPSERTQNPTDIVDFRDHPISASTPMKPRDGGRESADLARIQSLPSLPEQNDVFHDTIDTVYPPALNDLSNALDQLQRDLNSTTNRVRELEFQSRPNSTGTQPAATETSTGLLSDMRMTTALLVVWPVVVHLGMRYLLGDGSRASAARR